MNILASSQEPVIKSSVINKARNNHNLYGIFISVNSVQFSHSVMSNSLRPHGLTVHHQLLDFTQTHVHGVSDAIQPSSSADKVSACNVGDLGLIPGLGRSPGEEKDCLLQYSGLVSVSHDLNP